MLLCYPAPVVQVIQPQAARERELAHDAQTLSGSGWSYERRLVRAPQTGVLLDTVVLRPPHPSARWVLYAGGNAQFMENSLPEGAYYGRQLAANVVLYNPRGVGRSSGGYVAHTSDLVEDAAAVAHHYAQTVPIAPRQLLFVGHSIGGGVVAEVAARCFPDSSLVLDRSFSSLREAAVGFSPLSARLTQALLPLCVGDLRTMDAWYALPHQRKMILYTRLDEILRYDLCSPARETVRDIVPRESYASRVVELHGAGITTWHNTALAYFAEAPRVLATMSTFFAATDKK
ncbi:hypothetical protein STCU_01367 [Strigomonas culicis]|nr:hypothetical protein STCU_01367 [Strigomonas culicis]|eukprot:EPY34735.1 hypothetical protein STCU_01367 [Strigomonas culicis]